MKTDVTIESLCVTLHSSSRRQNSDASTVFTHDIHTYFPHWSHAVSFLSPLKQKCPLM